ncbi:hypothetical protein BDZ89DRAFT_1063569 [Hymenopellis radicata]|nr:hypothetical protein BDZ89DRAFT_1063569 [Hymenopellis radicata]
MATCARCGFKPASSATDSQLAAWNVDVLNVLRSGDALPSAATGRIPGRVAVLEARHQVMQDDLACLEELVAQKRKEVASARAEIEQIKSLAAPIRFIPHEILLHIFSLVDVALHSRQPPCSFGHVCKFWRTLSRSAPSLWSHVDVRQFRFRGVPGQYPMDVLEQHLILSNPRPLNVSFKSYDSDPRTTEAVLDALSVHSIRLQELKIDAGNFETECFFSMLSKADLRHLQGLTVHCSKNTQPVLTPYNIVLSSLLRAFHTNLPFSAFESVHGQWQTLTSFIGLFAGAGSFHRFIVAAENLASLRISCIGDEEDSQTRTMFVHERLTDLTVGPSCSMSLALNDISLPHLENLILENQYGPHSTCPVRRRQTDDTVLSCLLERSQCNLKTFILRAVYLTPQTLTSIWRMSNLISLQLRLDSDTYLLSETSTLLDSLIVTPSQQSLPSLRELSITAFMAVDHLFTNSKLYDVVASRWNVTGNVSRLSKLTLENEKELNKPCSIYETSTFASFLLNLKDQGLDVVWRMEYGGKIYL